VSRTDDSEHYAAAEAISQGRPQWMVQWGCYSRLYWGFPLFETSRRIFVCVAYPDALAARLNEAERQFRIRPQRKGGDPA
jgi:hypothetical protein